jgi:glycosyltransferase involved in cell wall biosynthesis
MPMDVAYVTDQRFFEIGGAWYTTASFRLDQLARALDVGSLTIFGRLDRGGDPERLFRLEPPAALAGRVRFEGPREQRKGPMGYAESAAWTWRALGRVVRASDVVWLKVPTVHAVLAQPHLRRWQVVVSQQMGDAEAGVLLTYPRWGFVRHLLRRSCRSLAGRADVAAFVSRDLAARYGGGRADVVVANESQVSEDLVLDAPPPLPGGPFRVVYAGRLAPEKCVDDLLRAVARVPGVSLTVVGDGARRVPLQALARTLGIDDRVSWLGYVPWGPGLLATLRGCAVLCLPSATEGLGLVIVEAMSQGLPVVGTRVGGIPELVADGVNGLLVDVHRPDQLAAAFERLRGDPALRLRMASAALETARQHTVERQLAPLAERIARVFYAKRAARAAVRVPAMR